jgi:hypothetical protein
MNWFAKFVIEPSGLIAWREGMLVHNQDLFVACEVMPMIALVLYSCTESGIVVGEA